MAKGIIGSASPKKAHCHWFPVALVMSPAHMNPIAVPNGIVM